MLIQKLDNQPYLKLESSIKILLALQRCL